MNVLVLSPGADTGGQGYRIKKAFEGVEGYSVKAVHGKETYIKYPSDIFWSKDLNIQELYDWADVVHHKNRLDTYVRLDGSQKKPTVIHHQGTRLRTNVASVRREDSSIGAYALVSTVDLLECYPEATWLPAPLNVDSVAKYRITRERPDIRICQCPTNRVVKSTDVVLAAIDRLTKGRGGLLFDLVENVEWRVALSRKGRCDIFVDQLHLGYGNNAIEAWAMGLPVISGVESQQTREKMLELWGELPFYEANVDNFEEKLMDMVNSPKLRLEYGAKGLAHVKKFHSEENVVRILKEVYENAESSFGVNKAKLALVR